MGRNGHHLGAGRPVHFHGPHGGDPVLHDIHAIAGLATWTGLAGTTTMYHDRGNYQNFDMLPFLSIFD
jgi:hypothetical protein